MLVSPFTFFRGAALVMATDLAETPRSGVTVQLCGDAHLSNFGLFGSPERRMLFDINDFDETLPGPWEWDLKRLAASFEIMGRDRGFPAADRRDIVMAGVREYQDRMRRASEMGSLQAWYEHMEAGVLLKLVRKEVRLKRISKRDVRATDEMVSKARTRDSTRVLAKRTNEVDGELRIVAEPPLIIPIEDITRPGSEWEDPAPAIKRLLSSYRRTLAIHHHPLEEYRYVHAALKVVGVGSVGTRCYILLLLGRDSDDPLFLQVKEAQAVRPRAISQPERVLAPRPASSRRSTTDAGCHGHLPRLAAHQGSRRRYSGTTTYGSSTTGRAAPTWTRCSSPLPRSTPGSVGRRLARAHARWGDRIAIASYLGQGQQLRPRDRQLRSRVRRPERTRL